MKEKSDLDVIFFKDPGSKKQPVKEWMFKELNKEERKTIGADLRFIQNNWPVRMPLVYPLEKGIYELRNSLPTRICRLTFDIIENEIVIFSGFIKKTQKTPRNEIEIALKRRAIYLNSFEQRKEKNEKNRKKT